MDLIPNTSLPIDLLEQVERYKAAHPIPVLRRVDSYDAVIGVLGRPLTHVEKLAIIDWIHIRPATDSAPGFPVIPLTSTAAASAKAADDPFIEDLAVIGAATPGPWEWHVVDDGYCMNARTITVAGESGELEDHENNIAIVLLQEPCYADIADHRWDENAEFIVRARERWPEAIARVVALEQQVDSLRRQLTDLKEKTSGK